MTYSIIISYRDRLNHLETLLPRLQEVFKQESYEIIVSEQNNEEKFQKNSLYNIAALRSRGELLIFHDVDYYPSENVSYYTDSNTPLYPVRNVVFLDRDNNQRDIKDIPSGYSNFINDVGDHSGGVFVLHKSIFEKCKGFNPYYKGWGKEDDDTRDRLKLLGYSWNRNPQGLFYCLYHKDNKPDNNDVDFINNHILLSNIRNTLHLGFDHVSAEVEEFELAENIKWLKVSDFRYANQHI